MVYGGSMIHDYEHCVEIQKRRQAAGKRGYAKAVRRYLTRTPPGAYRDAKAGLPVSWPDQVVG